MATNAPPSRKTHIVRITGTNRDGERLDDMWVDLERMDVIKGATQIPPDFQWQGWQRKLRWSDDPDGEDEYFQDGPPSRLTRILKVCDPETQDVDDPDEWVPVPIIRGMRSRGGSSESMGQGSMDRFRVSEDDDGNPETARVAEVRKIVHYDTNIDDDAQAAFDADPGRTNYVVSAEFYEKDLGTKDDSQHVEHEIAKFFKLKTNNEQVMGLGRQAKLLNQYLIDESEEPDGETIGIGGINPPYRLDPFQNIVNVNFVPQFLVGLFPHDLSPQIIAQDPSSVVDLGTKTDDGGITVRFYRVSPSLNESFLQTTNSPIAGTIGPAGVFMLVFPLLGDDDSSSVDQAYALAKDWILNSNVETEIPSKCLFVSGVSAGIPSAKVIWKFSYTKHRFGNSSPPPNRMAQVFPVSMSPNIFVGDSVPVQTAEVMGFIVPGYRLDKKIDGVVYKTPPEWKSFDTFVQDGGVFSHPGIRFADQLPLIAVDVPA